ncbi:hypothetical protein R3P82_12720 [Dietzia maris]|uniref:Uncharacterized protein n=1 Tax=Dietzia maris TaxID=37915 RepID=A0AAE4QZC8_9ACTN|nr:hypothetical protein [Dietzia maris]MDV6299973.1 hypothetical protein [Dietzia maris]
MSTTDTPTCGQCARDRTDADIDYSPMQAVMGQPCGWYSGDDGELCGHCMDEILARQR